MAKWLNGARGRLWLFSYAAIQLFSAAGVATLLWAPARSDEPIPVAERELVRLTNDDRAHEHIAPLAQNDLLAQAAYKHVREMMRRHKLSHQFPGEPSVAERIAATHLRFQASGENVAFFTERGGEKRNAEEANDLLMHSPPHRENILKPGFNSIGVAMASDGEDVWVVEDFARAFAATSVGTVMQQVEDAMKQERASHSLPPLKFQHNIRLNNYACRSDVTASRVLQASPGAHAADIFTTWDAASLSPGATKHTTARETTGVALGACEVSNGSGSYRVVVLFF